MNSHEIEFIEIEYSENNIYGQTKEGFMQFDITNGTPRAFISIGKGTVKSFSIHSNRLYVFLQNDNENTLTIWDLTTNSLVQSHKFEDVSKLDSSNVFPNGKILIIGELYKFSL